MILLPTRRAEVGGEIVSFWESTGRREKMKV